MGLWVVLGVVGGMHWAFPVLFFFSECLKYSPPICNFPTFVFRVNSLKFNYGIFCKNTTHLVDSNIHCFLRKDKKFHNSYTYVTRSRRGPFGTHTITTHPPPAIFALIIQKQYFSFVLYSLSCGLNVSSRSFVLRWSQVITVTDHQASFVHFCHIWNPHFFPPRFHQAHLTCEAPFS